MGRARHLQLLQPLSLEGPNPRSAPSAVSIYYRLDIQVGVDSALRACKTKPRLNVLNYLKVLAKQRKPFLNFLVLHHWIYERGSRKKVKLRL